LSKVLDYPARVTLAKDSALDYQVDPVSKSHVDDDGCAQDCRSQQSGGCLRERRLANDGSKRAKQQERSNERQGASEKDSECGFCEYIGSLEVGKIKERSDNEQDYALKSRYLS
jgi:hypothetical protein